MAGNGSGSKALVVTGAGRGIGSRIAVQAAAAGFPVVIVYRTRHEEAEATLRQVIESGGDGLTIQADVSQEADVVRVFEAVDARFDSLAGLVNNAASNGGRARLMDLKREQLNVTFETNIYGSFLCAREAARRMSTQRGGEGGAIVNISSGASKIGSPGVWVHYAASKAALETMSLGLAKELAPDGIRVNVVRCGVIDTEVHAGHGEDRLQQLMSQVPMARMGRPDEVAAAAMFLLSAQASYITGAVLDVSGGL
jgi:NAD(P)-dependent dehydrogenase (short-subunit alcohol dehydrogenase family)